MEYINNIVMPVVVAILGWILSFLSGEYTYKKYRKWMCRRESDSGRYVRELLSILFIGVGLEIVGVVLTEHFSNEIIRQFDFVMPKIMKHILASSLSTVYLVVIMIILFKSKQRRLIRGNKFKKIIKFIMNYVPSISVLLICDVAMYWNNPIFNNVLIVAVLLCEISAYVFLDNKCKAEYTYALLCFTDGSQLECLTDNVRQSGNWIIIKNGECEIRYRQEELKNVKFFNLIID